MLRIAYLNTDQEERLTLSGQLAGPWVSELRHCWVQIRRRAAVVVDLSDVTFIDEAGERLLCDMREAGATFVAAGVETKHLINNLSDKGKRPLRRSINPMTCRCETPHTNNERRGK